MFDCPLHDGLGNIYCKWFSASTVESRPKPKEQLINLKNHVMRKTLLSRLFLGTIGVILLMCSCQSWDKWDPSAGGQKLPPVVVDASYANVSNPTLGKAGDTYFIISSNAIIDGVDPQEGLMVRRTKDFTSFEGMTDENAYILSDVLSEWGYDRLKELDPDLSNEEIKIGQPCLREVGGEWVLFYSIATKADEGQSVIGYATAQTPDGEWVDKGEILSSESGEYAAYGAKFFTSIDGAKNYLVFGRGAQGIFVTELDKDEYTPIGSPTKIAGRVNGEFVENPVIVAYQGYYHLIFTYKTFEGVWCTAHTFSREPMSGYKDLAGRDAVFLNQWAITRVLNDFHLNGGPTWSRVTGVDVLLEGDTGYVVHQAKTDSEPMLHVRKLNWVPADSRRAMSPEVPIPAISPEEYKGPISTSGVTNEQIAGDWFFGTLWAHMNSGINDGPKTFNADGTYSGGSWDYNANTKMLHLNSTEWGGENLYLHVSIQADNLSSEKGQTVVVASGYNDSFSDHPGVWMRKETTKDEPDVEGGRDGVYAPSAAYDGGVYYVYSGNSNLEGISYEHGLTLQSSDDLIFFDPEGYVLSDVIEDWGRARLQELNSSIDEKSEVLMDFPSVHKVKDNEWRLYYTLHCGETSLIGYATASAAKGPWTDKGEVIASTAQYKAIAPSYTYANDKHYMAFGESDKSKGVFMVELDATSGKSIGEPQVIASCAWDTGDGANMDANTRAGFPELFYKDNKFYLFFTYSNLTYYMATSDQPFGPYKDWSNVDVTSGRDFARTRILTPYQFTETDKWGYTYNGFGVVDDGEQWFVLHQAAQSADQPPQMHVRELDWLSDSRIASNTIPFPAISPSVYTGKYTQPITEESMTKYGWKFFQYGEYKWLPDSYNVGVDFVLNDDHTFTSAGIEGTWSLYPEKNLLHIVIATYGNENFYAKVRYSIDENGDLVLTASGLNDGWFDHPAMWMKQIP